MKRHTVERNSKAEIRPGEQSEKTETCRENFMHLNTVERAIKTEIDTRQQQHPKRSGQARLVYVFDVNRNIPITWRWARGDNKTLPNKWWCQFTADERYQQQLNETNYLDLNANTRLKSSCIATVTTAPQGGHIESWWEKEAGLEVRFTFRLSPTIWSTATRDQWSGGPMKWQDTRFHRSASLVSRSNWSDHRTGSDSGLGPLELRTEPSVVKAVIPMRTTDLHIYMFAEPSLVKAVIPMGTIDLHIYMFTEPCELEILCENVSADAFIPRFVPVLFWATLI